MKIVTSYSVRLRQAPTCLKDTLVKYREAVDWFIVVMDAEWNAFADCSNNQMAVRVSEKLCVKTQRMRARSMLFPILSTNSPLTFAEQLSRKPSALYRLIIQDWITGIIFLFRNEGADPPFPKPVLFIQPCIVAIVLFGQELTAPELKFGYATHGIG